jgi:16S rRNA (guanine966-N2)-methyltransferase
VRPTPEPVRERCLGLVAEDVKGARVADLFAGTGSLGLEALSRGARSVDFVENAASALHALKANVAALRATKQTRIFKRDVIPWVESLPAGAYDLAFVDPPYGSIKLDRVLERWREVPFADVLVIEHAKDHDLGPGGKRYDFEGPTRVTILRA